MVATRLSSLAANWGPPESPPQIPVSAEAVVVKRFLLVEVTR